MNRPTSIVCADHAGPCELCGAECWALVDGHRVHSLTCWPMLTGGHAMTATDTTQGNARRCCDGPRGCSHTAEEWAAVGVDMWKLTDTIADTFNPARCSYCADPDCITIWVDPDGRPANPMCGPFQLDKETAA